MQKGEERMEKTEHDRIIMHRMLRILLIVTILVVFFGILHAVLVLPDRSDTQSVLYSQLTAYHFGPAGPKQHVKCRKIRQGS